MERARALKARADSGTAYPWEVSQIAFHVAMARSDMRLARTCDDLRDLGRRK
jgi:hypothetical protein